MRELVASQYGQNKSDRYVQHSWFGRMWLKVSFAKKIFLWGLSLPPTLGTAPKLLTRRVRDFDFDTPIEPVRFSGECLATAMSSISPECLGFWGSLILGEAPT